MTLHNINDKIDLKDNFFPYPYLNAMTSLYFHFCHHEDIFLSLFKKIHLYLIDYHDLYLL